MKKSTVFTCLALLLIALLTASLFSSCGSDGNTVIIYTSAEDYRVAYMQQRLKEEFPDYDIIIEYMPTGEHAARLFNEGKTTEADITYDLEYGYLDRLANAGLLANLKKEYDFSIYTEDAVASSYYLPEYKNGGAIIINPKVLAAKGLEAPTSYADLLKPEYKNLISMPDPKSSGTGYMFLKTLVNTMGEDNAFAYFDGLSENILQYTSSGSGPVNALIQEEVAIGLGITGQAVTAINDGAELEIVYFDEGSPFAMYGQGIVAGREEKKAVKDVFDFLIETYAYENCQNFFPEQIFKDKTFEIDNYPSDIVYSDMSGNTLAEKDRLLAKWEH